MILVMSSPNVFTSASISHNPTIRFQNFFAICEVNVRFSLIRDNHT